MAKIIELKNIEKIYGSLVKTQVLFDLNLDFEEGSFSSIIGQSGSGKSTLLNIMGTLDTPTSGKLIIDGKNTEGMNKNKLAELRNETMGFIFQFHHLLPEFTALENVLMPTRISGKNEKESMDKAFLLFEELHIAHRIQHKPKELSGGEAQRVAVARALINSPKIIFADEPTGNLDSKNADALHQLFFDLRDRYNQTFVIVTHNKELAESTDRKLVMKDGLIL